LYPLFILTYRTGEKFSGEKAPFSVKDVLGGTFTFREKRALKHVFTFLVDKPTSAPFTGLSA
jgi:hypothetical protein